MRNKTKIILLILILPVIIASVLLIKHNINMKTNITYILDSKDYSYLPEEAKEYIKTQYEETGNILKTEKNKVEEEPYLNPAYVEYLETGEASEYGYIPEPYIIEHSYASEEKVGNSSLDGANEKASLSYYNLRDEGYITNIYDQGSEGICWSFASTTALESHIAIQTNKSKLLTFSEKQIDYATTRASESIDIGKNSYQYTGSNTAVGETLNEGGNVLRYVNAAAIGISPVECEGNCSAETNYNANNTVTDDKYWKYDYYYSDKLAPSEVLNKDITSYSIDEALFYNPLTSSSTTADVTSLVAQLKEQIVENGSLYVSIGAYTNAMLSYTPTGDEEALNDDGKNIILYNPAKFSFSSNHAVSLIGWDDNYTHNVCVYTSGTTGQLYDAKKTSAGYTCSKGTLETIEGAWIIQNSWGNEDTFIYLPYNSLYSLYSSISEVSEVDYDNSYRAQSNLNTINKVNGQEKITKVKFYLAYYNKTVNVLYNSSTHKLTIKDSSVSTSAVTYGDTIKTVSYTQPGIYTIDLSDQNIILDNDVDTFTFEILNGTKTYIDYTYYASIHTVNVDNTKDIEFTKNTSLDESILAKCNLTDNKCTDEPHQIAFDDNNAFLLSAKTRNLTSSDNITIKVLNSNSEDVTNLFHIFRNYAVTNYMDAIVSYNSSTLPLGSYTFEAYYNNVLYDTFSINISSYNNTMAGIGTEYNPYLITTATELNNIRNKNTAGVYYKLNNDIDLTYDTTNSNGAFYNSGKGWTPIDFYGNFDGNNHVISGLYINNDVDKGGLFGTVYGTNNYIKNLTIKDAFINVTNSGMTGSLIGSINATDYISISNISVVGGKVNDTYYAGGVIGQITSPSTVDEVECDLTNIYSNIVVGTTDTVFAGGIVAVIEEASSSKLNVTITDAISYSKVNGKGNLGSSSIGGIVGDAANNKLIINNVISAGSYITLGTDRLGDIVGLIATTNTTINNAYYLNNIYGTNSSTGTQTITNNTKVTLDNILTNNYTNTFTNSSYWTKPTINNIVRLPLPTNIKDVFDYTEVTDNNRLIINKTKSIYDWVTPKTNSGKNITWSYDSNYLTISDSGTITPNKVGNTTVTITSLYDGYKKDINVSIIEGMKITYHANNGTNSTSTQTVEPDTQFSLNNNTYTYKGYTFNSWNTNANGTGTSYTNGYTFTSGISENLDLYATWDAINYKINFKANGGVGTDDSITVTYPSNGTITLGTRSYTKANNVFANWNTKANGTGTNLSPESINFDTIPFDNNHEVTLYAIWSKEVVKVTFDDGTGNTTNQNLNKGEDTILNTNSFSKTGYLFTSWNTKVDGTGTTYSNLQVVNLTSDLYLYAIWTPITYEISYDANGGTGTMTNTSATYDESVTLRDNEFTNNNLYFKEWNTSPDGSGTKYANKASVKNLTTENNKVITLYAIWESNPVITYTSNNIDLMYDGAAHGIVVTPSIEGCTVTYSSDGINYNLSESPMFTDPGYYTVYFKISKTGYDDVTGYNLVTIYGVKSISSDVVIKDYIITLSDNNSGNLENYLEIISKNGYSIEHLDVNMNPPGRSYFKTEDRIRITYNDYGTVEYFVAYRGDVNGDGNIGIIDYIRIMKHIMGTASLGGCYKEAADMNRNGKIDIIDYVRIMKIIMGVN